MLRKTRAKDFYAGYCALSRAYGIPNPVSRPPRNGEARMSLDQYLSSCDDMQAILGVKPYIVYAFLNGYIGSTIAKIHPFLEIEALFSKDSRNLRKEIIEAHNRGKDAGKRDRATPGLEKIATLEE